MENFFWPIFVGNKDVIENDENIISYHLMKDGIYCKRKVFKDKFIFYKDNDVPDLIAGKDDLNPIKDIKIPAILLQHTMNFFKYVLKHFKTGMEAYVLYAINPENKYFMYVPKQEVGAASVHYDISDFYKEHPGCYIVADAHSHVKMGAFWSGTDTKDDCRGRYSVVIGKNDKIIPEIKCRFNYGSKYIELSIDDIFEDNDNFIDINYDFSELIKNLEEEKVVIVPFNSVGKGNNGNSAFDYSSYYGGMWDEDFDYASYYYNSRKLLFEDRSALNVKDGISRCTRCGKFVKNSLLEKFDEDYLCEKCAKKTGAFHACP